MLCNVQLGELAPYRHSGIYLLRVTTHIRVGVAGPWDVTIKFPRMRQGLPHKRPTYRRVNTGVFSAFSKSSPVEVAAP